MRSAAMPRLIASSRTASEFAVASVAAASMRRIATRGTVKRSNAEPQTLRRDTATGTPRLRATGIATVAASSSQA